LSNTQTGELYLPCFTEPAWSIDAGVSGQNLNDIDPPVFDALGNFLDDSLLEFLIKMLLINSSGSQKYVVPNDPLVTRELSDKCTKCLLSPNYFLGERYTLYEGSNIIAWVRNDFVFITSKSPSDLALFSPLFWQFIRSEQY